MIVGRSWYKWKCGSALALTLLAGCGRIAFAPAGGDPSGQADASVGSTWALVQTMASTSSPLAIAPSGSQHLIIVAVQLANAGAVTSIVDNPPDNNAPALDDSNVYVAIPAARATNTSPSDALELWYANNSRPGAAAISITATTTVVAAMA